MQYTTEELQTTLDLHKKNGYTTRKKENALTCAALTCAALT